MPAGTCTGRVVVITGAGNGIGRAHALAFAAQGAKVVVNDLGGARDGAGSSVDGSGPAQAVADEIAAAGGEAVANTDDISSWAGAQRLIEAAVDAFGGLDVVVNNAGILRDRMIVTMTEPDWDAVSRSGKPRRKHYPHPPCRLCAGRRWLTLVVGNAQNIPF